MRVIIAGAGEVGRGVATALRQERRSVALIDPNPTAINESQSLDCLLVTGSALSRDSHSGPESAMLRLSSLPLMTMKPISSAVLFPSASSANRLAIGWLRV